MVKSNRSGLQDVILDTPLTNSSSRKPHQLSLPFATVESVATHKKPPSRRKLNSFVRGF